MLQPDCEPIMQTIQSLEHQTQEIDDRIGVLETKALQLNSLQYIVSQRKIDRLVRMKHALQDKWAMIQDLTFHDLRHDFAYRAREAGWSLEEVTHYLGLTTMLPIFS